MPARLASRVNRPRIRQAPTRVSRHIVIRLALASMSGGAASEWNDPASGPLACLRYPAADHDGAVSLVRPS